MPVGFSEISVFVYLVDPDLHPSLWIRILEDLLKANLYPKHWYKKKICFGCSKESRIDMSLAVLGIQIHWIWIRIQDFGPIWIRIQGYTNNLKEKIYNNLEKNYFIFTKLIFLNYRNKMSHKEICIQSSLWTVNLYLKSYIFCLHFFSSWLRIQ